MRIASHHEDRIVHSLSALSSSSSSFLPFPFAFGLFVWRRLDGAGSLTEEDVQRIFWEDIAAVRRGGFDYEDAEA